MNLYRIPEKKIALLNDFEKKREQIARSAMNARVTNISGVPSWMLALLKRILELKGTDNLTEVWPDLEVFFHGGVAFTPYSAQYKQLIPSDRTLDSLKFLEKDMFDEYPLGLVRDKGAEAK